VPSPDESKTARVPAAAQNLNVISSLQYQLPSEREHPLPPPKIAGLARDQAKSEAERCLEIKTAVGSTS